MESPERSFGGSWENLVCRSGLCDWCRGCMPMRRAVFMLVRDTVKSLKWRLVFTKARFSARCSSSLCSKPCQANSALGSPGRTAMPMTLLSLLYLSRNMSGGFLLGRMHWRRKGWESIDWLCWGLTTRQPLRVILCRLPEKGRKEIEERVEEMKERDREERGTGMKVKKQKK